MVDNSAGGDNVVRLQFAGVDQFVGFHQRDVCCESNQGVKVAGAELVGEVSECVATVGADQRQVCPQWTFKQPGFAIEGERLFAFFDDGADTGWGEKTTKSGTATANLLNQCTLRYENDLHFARNHAPSGFRVSANM